MDGAYKDTGVTNAVFSNVEYSYDNLSVNSAIKNVGAT